MELSVEALAEDDIEAAAGELVAKLESKHSEDAALRELRVMSRGDERCRRYIADAGGVEALVSLILQRSNSDSEVQENAITTLLNLSIDPLVRLRITETYSALDAILVLLSYGHTAAVKENAAATLFSLLIVEDYREVVGKHPLAIPALLALLRDAPTRRGKKDAIKVSSHDHTPPPSWPKYCVSSLNNPSTPLITVLLCWVHELQFWGLTPSLV